VVHEEVDRNLEGDTDLTRRMIEFSLGHVEYEVLLQNSAEDVCPVSHCTEVLRRLVLG
jgi:hypothetical protein